MHHAQLADGLATGRVHGRHHQADPRPRPVRRRHLVDGVVAAHHDGGATGRQQDIHADRPRLGLGGRGEEQADQGEQKRAQAHWPSSIASGAPSTNSSIASSVGASAGASAMRAITTASVSAATISS